MTVIDALAATRLVAIVRGTDAAHARASALTLLDAGFVALEITLTTPGALDLIAELSASHAHIGAGTVLTEREVGEVADAGATFVVTPGIAPSLGEAARLGLPTIAGVFTASEVIAALDLGAAAVKLFPADVGGPPYLAALRAPLPNVRFVPVGGVTLDAAPRYLEAGAFALGLGSPLLGDAVSGGSLEALRERAEQFIAIAQPGEPT
jgi:2-dehydro-3-deoxyphosphogluconate aldolase/(4S)-4-hydroxy-2-oxoglutarate aldolase